MFRQLLYPFLPYRSFAYPILVLSAIVVPCWLAFRLYRHRAGRQPLSFHREILLLLFVVYLAALAAATLSPNRSSRLRAEGTGGIELRPTLAALTCSSTTARAAAGGQAFCARNAAGNVALFFPFGILVPLLRRRLRFWTGIRIAIALSFGIELVQYLSSSWGSYRAADVNDLVLNVVGASLGFGVVYMLRRGEFEAPNDRR
jgi:glycopeptide antibiotics resistance protein